MIYKSIFEHDDINRLIREFAGCGEMENSNIPGSPGYVEKVNFREKIGFSINNKTNISTETTWGKIHYSKDGVHIVPTHPPLINTKEGNTEKEHVNEFLLNTRTALLDSFCQNLRAIEVDVKDNMLITWFYFDGEITEENKEFASIVTCESSSYFEKGFSYNYKYYLERLDYPLRISGNGRFAYLRYEEPATQGITYTFLGHPLKKLLSAFGNEADISTSEVFWPPLISLLLQEAFLGCIKPNLRSVKGELDELEKILYIWIYFEGKISDNDLCVMNIAIDKIKTYFKDYFLVKSFIDRLDRPQRIPTLGTPIFCGNMWKKGDEQVQVEDSEKNISLVAPQYDLFYFKDAIQDALLGKVVRTLRSVKIEIDEMRKVLYFWFYYNGEISQRDRLNADSVIKFVEDRLNGKFSSIDKIVRLDYPNKIPSIGWPVYQRDEQKNV